MSPVLRRSEILKGDSIDRLDAEFFDSGRIEREQALKEAGGTMLGDHYRLCEARIPDPRKAPASEISYVEIGAVDTRDGFVFAERLPGADAPSRARLALGAGMVALSHVRPIRSQVFRVTEDLDGAVGTTGFILLDASNGTELDPALLFAMLKTRLVIDQLDRRARASMYPSLNPPDIREVVLPPLSDAVRRSVRRLIATADSERAAFLDLSARTKEFADAYFETLGAAQLLDDLSRREATERQLRTLSSEGEVGRLDAEFHAGAYERAVARMEGAGEVSVLGDLVSAIGTGSSWPASELSELDRGDGPAVVRVASLTNVGINWAAVLYGGPGSARSEADQVHEGDILFTSTAHQPKYMAHKVDVVSSVPSELESRLTFVGDLMRVRIADHEISPPHYVAAFLRNPLGKEQIRRCIRGVSSHVYPDDVANVVVPMPPAEVMGKISEDATRLEELRWSYSRAVRDAIEEIEAHVASIV